MESLFSESQSDDSGQMQPNAHMCSTDVAGIVWKFG